MSAGRSDREEAARLLRCECIPSWKFHANNCPVQPGEYQENWARQADARIGDEREMCVHCGRHPTAYQEVQALREEVETLRELDEMHHGCPDFVELRERVAALQEEIESLQMDEVVAGIKDPKVRARVLSLRAEAEEAERESAEAADHAVEIVDKLIASAPKRRPLGSFMGIKLRPRRD